MAYADPCNMQNCRWRRGFKQVSEVEIETLVDNIDHDRQELLCIPLARPPAHNPIYGFKADINVPFDQLIWDVGMMNPPDCWGLVAIEPLERGDIGPRQFWCAKVRFSDGQEGWINVAFRNMHNTRMLRLHRWLLYFKLVVISRCLCGNCPRSWLERGWRCSEN